MGLQSTMDSAITLRALRGYRTFLAGWAAFVAAAMIAWTSWTEGSFTRGAIALLLVSYGLRLAGDRGRPLPPPSGVKVR